MQGTAAARSTERALRAYAKENPRASVADMRDFAIGCLQSAGDLYGNACSQAAFELQDAIALEFGYERPALHGWLYEPDRESIERTARFHAGKLPDDLEGFVSEMAEAARYYAERGANATMSQTAKRQAEAAGKTKKAKPRRKGAETHGVRFARVPQGAVTCRDCLLWASRGFVYLSRESAGEFDKFHPGCDCKIIPGYDGMQLEGHDPGKYARVLKRLEEAQITHANLYSGRAASVCRECDEIDEQLAMRWGEYLDAGKTVDAYRETVGKYVSGLCGSGRVHVEDGLDLKRGKGKEVQLAKWFADAGDIVELRSPSDGDTNDALVNGERWEFKRITTLSRKKFKRRITEKLGRQGPNFIADLSTSGMKRGDAEYLIAELLEDPGIEKIVLVMNGNAKLFQK